VRWIGRVDAGDPEGPRFAWSGTGFVARVTGGSVRVRLANADRLIFKAVVDGVPAPAFAVAAGEGTYPLASGLDPAAAPGGHTIALHRQTEGVFGTSQLLALLVEGGAVLDPPAPTGRLIEVVGASVSCGYGDLGAGPCGFSVDTESHFDAYESVAARAVGAELMVVAVSGRGVYRNSDGTTTGTMPLLFDRILPDAAAPAWDFHATPQAVVINLGKNDFAFGDPGPAFVDAYVAFAGRLRQQYPGALIVCTTGPNLGAAAHAQQLAYVRAAVARRFADGDAGLELVDWPEQTEAELGCDGHPNVAKHETMGTALAAVLRARLGW
jgi:lysophospholipase L1-like esterase